MLRYIHNRLRCPARLPVFDDHIGIYAATHPKFGAQAHETWLAGRDQVIENPVGHVLVKGALIAERPDVQLQGLEFDAQLVRDIFKVQGGKVRLAGFWAQAGELRHPDTDDVITFGMWTGKGIQILAGLGRHRLEGYGHKMMCASARE